MSPPSVMLPAMQKQREKTPLRWQVADRLAGRNARVTVWTTGGLVAVVALFLMLFRPYEGRPLRLNPSGVVEQSAIQCPAARTALTRPFNKADPSVPDQVRVCVETGRAKAFTAGLALMFIAITTWGASLLAERGRSRRSGDGPSRWDRAIARAKSQADQPNERTG